MMRSMSILLTVLAGLLMTGAVLAQQPKPKELNNVEIQSKTPAGTLVFRFEDGILQYTFTEGPRAGAGGVDLDYWARTIGEDMYLVGWHDEMFSNVFSMVFDLKNKVDYTNAIMFYGTDSQNIFWADSVIEKVTPIE